MEPKWTADATTFQNQLSDLTTTLALKVQREGVRTIGIMAAADIYVLLRQAQRTYELFFYLNADERRKEPFWRAYYTFCALPLIRSMIDCLFNITLMLEHPKTKPLEFRRSGYKMAIEALEKDEQKWDGDIDPDMKEWLRKRRENLDFLMRRDNLKSADVMAQKRWPTLGRYLQTKSDVPLTNHQAFLENLTLGYWREYSAYSHGTFQGLMQIAPYYLEQDLEHDLRPMLEEKSLLVIFGHMARASAILLCILTELQAYFRFDGARINERMLQVWDALLDAPEVRELFDLRYSQLMKDSRITP